MPALEPKAFLVTVAGMSAEAWVYSGRDHSKVRGRVANVLLDLGYFKTWKDVVPAIRVLRAPWLDGVHHDGWSVEMAREERARLGHWQKAQGIKLEVVGGYVPPIKLEGNDSDWMYFKVGSFSSEKVHYDLNIDKRNGRIHCSCPDAVCRRKKGDLLDESEGCKHVGLFFKYLNELLAYEEGVSPGD